MQGNGILALSFWLDVSLEQSMRSLFIRDPRELNSGVARMLVGAHVAALHVVLKTRAGETKILEKGF